MNVPLAITSRDCEDIVKRNTFQYLGKSLHLHPNAGLFVSDIQLKGEYLRIGCIGAKFQLENQTYSNHLLIDTIKIKKYFST